MLLLFHSNSREPGTWKQAGPGIKAHVTCPECKSTISLHNHTIDNDGKVSGYVMCNTAGCGWVAQIMLNNWQQMRNDQEPDAPQSTEPLKFYIDENAPEGGDGSKARPVRNMAELQDLIAPGENITIEWLTPQPKKKVSKKKTKKKAKKKIAQKRRTHRDKVAKENGETAPE